MNIQKNQSYLDVLALSTLINVIILFIRNYLTASNNYNFLLWNLFLGIVPFVVAWVLRKYADRINNLVLWIGCGLWLLFYPNAPYMITDLIHVNQASPTVLYDAVIIFSLAILSAFFGFYSLGLIYFLIIEKNGKLLANIALIASIFLSSFGIYLGRILRLNSWDVFTKPIETFGVIFHQLFPITKNPTTYTVIILFSFLQLMLLYLIVDMRETKK